MQPYLLLFLGVMLEPDAALLPAAFLVHQGRLQLLPVILTAAAAGVVAHSLTFLLTRRFGQDWFQRKAASNHRWRRAELSFKHHRVPWLFFSRFLWGLRYPVLCVAAVSDMSYPQFLALDVVGCLVWSCVLTAVGYFFGSGLELMSFHLHRHEIVIAVLLGIACVAGLIICRHAWSEHTARRFPKVEP